MCLTTDRLAASNVHYFYYPLSTAFREIAAAGYQNIAFFAGTPHFFVDSSGYSDCTVVKNLAKQNGLTIQVFHPELLSGRYSLCIKDPTWQTASMSFFSHSLEAAAELGTRIVSIDIAGLLLDEPRKVVYERCVRNLYVLARRAEELGLTLALATSVRDRPSCARTLWELKDILQAVSHPNLKAALSLPAMAEAGETIPQWFRDLGNNIVYNHFTDARSGAAQVWGQGTLPLSRTLRQIEAQGYPGLLGQFLDNERYQNTPALADMENMAAITTALAKME